jgi:hypothetical protein
MIPPTNLICLDMLIINIKLQCVKGCAFEWKGLPLQKR